MNGSNLIDWMLIRRRNLVETRALSFALTTSNHVSLNCLGLWVLEQKKSHNELGFFTLARPQDHIFTLDKPTVLYK